MSKASKQVQRAILARERQRAIEEAIRADRVAMAAKIRARGNSLATGSHIIDHQGSVVLVTDEISALLLAYFGAAARVIEEGA